jgi:hypothetical protein
VVKAVGALSAPPTEDEGGEMRKRRREDEMKGEKWRTEGRDHGNGFTWITSCILK